MRITKLFRMALLSIVGNKVRSFLTMLGIIIGISSVIVLVGMGQGTQKQIADQIDKLGTNLITISITGNRTKTITDSELKNLTTKPGIKNIAPTLSGNVNLKANTQTTTTSLEGVVPAYSEVRKIGVMQGRFITENDIEQRSYVAVIGSDTANTLFNSTNVTGETVYVNGIKFTIAGVLEAQGSSSNGSSDDRIIIPLSTAERLLQDTNVKTFYVEAQNKDKIDIAMGYLELFLNKKYNNNTNSYRIFDQTSLLETANSTNAQLTTMLGGTAAISLIVGGIGIMNIMLVSVIERTREIGIRKAIGAKRSTILAQFLIEASVISGIGGLLGVGFGYLASYVAQNFFNTAVSISNNIVLLAVIFSLAVGIIFGIYPASKASKLNPIDALRFE